MATPLSLEALSDRALLDRFALAVRQDRERKRLLLELIDVIDRRKLWAKQGYSSLFSWCVDRFHMSEPTAAKRIRAARCARRFPVLLDMVVRGELHLSGIHRLAAHLTPGNHHEVLGRAKHQTLKQIEALVRELCPQPDVPSSLRKLPERRMASLPSRVGQASTAEAESASATTQPSQPAVEPRSSNGRPVSATPPRVEPVKHDADATHRSPDPKPLSPGRYKLQVTLGEKANQALRQLQDLLAHQVANGDPAVIVERALEVLLAQTLKKKAALTERPRAPQQRQSAALESAPSRNIPAELKRKVWQRDQGCCGFVGADGKRCGETRGLEFAHRRPWAKGGPHSAENLSLRCKAHNAIEADRDYGEAFMRKKRERGPAPAPMASQAKSFRVREPRVPYGRGRGNSARASGRAASRSQPQPTLEWTSSCRQGLRSAPSRQLRAREFSQSSPSTLGILRGSQSPPFFASQDV